MSAATGFSCQYVSLAFALRLALDDYQVLRGEESIQVNSLVEAIEIPRARAIIVVLLNAALCEATINAVLSLKFTPAMWAEVDHSPTVKKWTTIPERIWPGCGLSASDPLNAELVALFDCRNAIMHPVPEVYEGADQRQPGNVKAWRTLDGKLVIHSHDLVLRLLKHLTPFDYSLRLHHDSIAEHLLRR
jgi:hypothetical protein